MIELLIHRRNIESQNVIKGCREPLGRALAVRGCNMIPVQATLQHVEVYNAANRLLSWAEDATFDDGMFQRIDAAALTAISHDWHLCKARSRWHRSSVFGADDRKHVLYLVPSNHPALVSGASELCCSTAEPAKNLQLL